MADWNLPTLTSTYTNVLTNLKDRDVESATQAYSAAPTNPPTNFIRFVSANNRWERWTGSAWVELSTSYALKIGTGSTIDNTPIGGTTQNTGGFSSIKVGTANTDATNSKLYITNTQSNGSEGLTIDNFSPSVSLVDRTTSAYSFRTRVDSDAILIEPDTATKGAGWGGAVMALSRLGSVTYGGGGIGSIAGITANHANLSGAIQIGVYSNASYDPTIATVSAQAFRANITIKNVTGSENHAVGYVAANPVTGANSTITQYTGVFAEDVTNTSVASAHGLTSSLNLVSGTTRWNLNSNGTAPNYIASDLRIGTTVQTGAAKLTVNGTVAVDAPAAGDSSTLVPNTAWTQTEISNKAILKTGGTLTGALNEASGADIPSAATTNIGSASGNYVQITGTTTITSFGAGTSGAVRELRFAGALTLTHNATSLILPTGANITTAAGDVARFRSEGGNNWRCVGYTRANGTSLVGVNFASAAENAAGVVENKAVDPLGIREAFNASGTAPVYAARAWCNFNAVPLTGTYVQSGTTITVTMTAHGMTVGQNVNLDFTTGTAVDASFTVVTVADANTFTVTAGAALTTSGSVTRNLFVRGSGNVSSVVDNGTGDYTVNFLVALPDAEYSVVGITNATSTSSTNRTICLAVTSNAQSAPILKTTSAVRVAVGQSSLEDSSNVSVTIFR